MKMRKFLTITAAMTIIALAYVGQQTELICLSYDIKDRERSYSDLLDRNRILLYNVERLESPARLEKRLLAKKIKLEVPSKERVILVSAASATSGASEARGIARLAGTFGKIRQALANIFILSAEAEAKPAK